jgi:peptide/nickel transport system permease protein
MFFSKKINDALARVSNSNHQINSDDTAAQEVSSQSFIARTKQQFRYNSRALWSWRAVRVLIFIAFFADVIANEKPLICSINHQVYCPIGRELLVSLNLAKWQPELLLKDWQTATYDWKISAPIPYSTNISPDTYMSPFDTQDKVFWQRHWLGTDDVGRDVAACMVAGTRVALSVGLISMSIALLIGLVLGTMSGFYGDTNFQLTRINALFLPLWLFLGFYYGFFIRIYTLADALAQSTVYFLGQFFISAALFTGILYAGRTLLIPFKDNSFWGKAIAIPLDLIITRFIELVVSIPTIIVLLTILAIAKPSIINIMLVLGLFGWTSITRFLRAELLRIRQLEYIEAARVLGLNNLRIILQHALPNAISPVMIVVAFGIAGAILSESFVSFLGIGLSPDSPSWGSMLAAARQHPTVWWLALFPGSAIFITVTLFNLIGEGLTDAIDPKLRR